MTPATPPADPLVAQRDAATQAIVDSPHPLRVIVAGPGTGKTTVFERALIQRGGGGLALTFLRLLADDLRKSLADHADAYTFHGFAKHRMKVHTPAGLTPRFEIYPPLMSIETWDLGVLGVIKVPQKIGPKVFLRARTFVENRLQTLDFGSGIPDKVLDLGSYYDAAAFPDLVLRMYLDYTEHPEHVPPFPLVVVDEYQDFSPLETAIIDLLGTKSDLLIAGDDDQALYAFREASPVAIRELAANPAAQRFSLPFCSRCTSVIVDAVTVTLGRATDIGRLQGRLAKPFRDYPPTKGVDSAANPKIFDVRCTSQDYIKRYVAARIAEVPEEDIRQAAAEGYPAVLVIGPAPFLQDVAEHLAGIYPEAGFKPSDKLPILPLDGYKYIARDAASNLGWRILVHVAEPPDWRLAVGNALSTGTPLVDHLSPEFRGEHLAVAELLTRAWTETLGAEDRETLASRLGVPADQLDLVLGTSQQTDSPDAVGGEQEESLTLGRGIESEAPSGPTKGIPLVPSIMFTSLLGAKGLSAAHVFVVGCSNGHFPRNATPTDEEVCEFVVALSRTRKACHLVSSRWLGRVRLDPSVFLRWVKDQTEPRWINKDNVPG